MRVCLLTRLLSSAACKRPQTSSVSKASFKRSVDWPSLNAWHPSAIRVGSDECSLQHGAVVVDLADATEDSVHVLDVSNEKDTQEVCSRPATKHAPIYHWVAAFQLERRGRRVVGARCIFESVDKQKPLPRSPGMAIFSRHASFTTKSTGASLAGL